MTEDDDARPTRAHRRVTRRRLLRLGPVLGGASLSGCAFGSGSGTTTDAADGGTSGSSSPDPAGTRTPDGDGTITFDGGGAAAFSSALRAAEERPGSTLAIEPGTYRLDGSSVGHSQPHAHFTADGLEGVTIEGNGARFVLTDPTLGALGLFDCRDLTLRNLELDYDPPPFTQGTIAAVEDCGRTVVVDLHEGFPTFDSAPFTHPELGRERRWATVHDPETGDFLDERSGGVTTIGFDDPERVGDRRYRIRNLDPARGIGSGRLFVAVARLPFKHAVLVANCAAPTFVNVALYASPAFAVLAIRSGAPTFRNVAVRPRPDSERAIGSNADGIHALGCAPGPTIEDCYAERLEDDAYVVATIMNEVEEVVDDRTVDVTSLVGTAISPGDTLEAIDEGFARRRSLPAVERVESTSLRLPGDWGWPARVTFASSIADALSPGDHLLNRSRANQGFAVRNCRSREIRARHVRVTSRDGLVEGNELDGCGFPAIMLAGGSFFSPQSPPENVTVRNNAVLRAGLNGFTTPFLGAIDAWINLAGWRTGPRPAGRLISGLTIEGNAVRHAAFKGIQVNDADGVTIGNNVVEHPNRVGVDGDDYGIGLENDRSVTLAGNQVRGTSAELDHFAVQRGTDGIDARSNALTIDGREVTPSVVDASDGA